MEHFLECYLDNFKEAPRNSLHDRRNRKAMVEYINTMIEGCSSVDGGDINITCKTAVEVLIRYHEKAKNSNGTVCMMGKYHNILYIALRLCYLWGLKDTELIAHLLQEIYSCEYTFERIVIGAIFGTKAPHYIAGWKSDFDDQEDNFRGLIYFLDKANRAKQHFLLQWNGVATFYRFIDLPIESCGKASVFRLSIQFGLADKVLILARFGAKISSNMEEMDCLEHLLNRLAEFNHRYPYNLVTCLQILLRTITTININNVDGDSLRVLMEEKYHSLISDGIIPLTRCGYLVPELKHLCRCIIREQLWYNFSLPHGISELPLPDKLRKYVDILED